MIAAGARYFVPVDCPIKQILIDFLPFFIGGGLEKFVGFCNEFGPVEIIELL